MSPSFTFLSFLAVSLLALSPPFTSASITICSRPSSWSLNDVVSQLAAANVDLNSTAVTLDSTTNSSLLQLRVSSKSAPGNVSLSLPLSTSDFSRSLFGDYDQEKDNNVTLVVLTNSGERKRLGTEQQIANLEAIYSTLLGVHLTNIRFVLLNSKQSFDPVWVAATRRKVSFEVYQEMEASGDGSNPLDGRNGDIFIYDRCGFLTYYIPFPLSFIHTQQPILQAAVLATYFDSPCKAKCNSSTSATPSTTPKPVSVPEVVSESSNITSVLAEVTTEVVSPSTEASSTESNQTESSFLSSALFNNSLLPMVNLTAEQAGNFNDMGQILMKFFGQISAEQQQQSGNGTTENTVTNDSSIQTNTTDGSRVAENGISNLTVSASSTPKELSVLDRLRGSQRPRLEVTTCTSSVCNEWSTERLLKARLCCLNSPEGDSTPPEIAPSNSSEVVTSTPSSSNLNSTSSNSSSSGFGCTLYARRNQCSQIMPVIRCCLRKVLNKYFDFTIRLRQQQQRSQGQIGSLTVDSRQAVAVGSASRDPNVLEYPADYVLGGVQQSDFLKQQHRKRVNRRVVHRR